MGVSAWRRDELTGTTELTTLHLPRTYQGCGKFLVSLARSGCGGPVELADIVARLRETGVEFEDVEVKRAAGGLPRSIAETMKVIHGLDSLRLIYLNGRRACIKDGLFLEMIGLPHTNQRNRPSSCIIPRASLATS